MKSSYVICLISALFLMNIPGGVAADDWVMFRHDHEHHAFTTEPAPDQGDVIWRHHVAEEWYGVIASPAVVDGVVYFGSDDGNVTALDASNGKVAWKVHVNDAPVRSSPAIDPGEGLLFINSEAIYALHISNGTEKWRFNTEENWEFSSPLIFDNVVYIGSYDGKLYALNETSGQMLWSYNTHNAPRSPNFNGGNGGIGSSPGTDGTRIFFGCTDNVFYAISIATHDIDWKYELGERIQGGPVNYPLGTGDDSYCSPSVDMGAGDNGMVYIGADDGKMYAFELEADGDGWDNDLDGVEDNEPVLVWEYQTDAEVISSPAVHDDRVIFGSYTDSSDNLFALNKENGNYLWSYQCGGPVFSSPAIAGDMVFVGSDDYSVYALNESDGGLVWSFATDSYVPSSPCVYEEIVYIGSVDYHLYALGSPMDRPDAAVGPGDLTLPSSITEDDQVDIGCRVHNAGIVNITSVDITLTVDEDTIYTDSVPINASEYFEFEVTWDAVLGNHTINLTLSNCQPSEKELDNNKVSKAIEVKEKGVFPEPGENWTFVDFSIESLGIEPMGPGEGEEITITVDVDNIGNGTGDGTVWIYLDEETSQNELLEEDISHAPDEMISYTTTYFGEPGEHTLIAVVECHNDTDNSSNRETLDFTVTEDYTQKKPDLNITRVELLKEGQPTENISEEDVLLIEVTVENQGELDTTAELNIHDGDPSLNKRIGYQKVTIKSGKSHVFRFSWSPVEGTHNLNIVVSSKVEEENLGNNEYYLNVYVGPKEEVDDDDDDFISIPPGFLLMAFVCSGIIFRRRERSHRRG